MEQTHTECTLCGTSPTQIRQLHVRLKRRHAHAIAGLSGGVQHLTRHRRRGFDHSAGELLCLTKQSPPFVTFGHPHSSAVQMLAKVCKYVCVHMYVHTLRCLGLMGAKCVCLCRTTLACAVFSERPSRRLASVSDLRKTRPGPSATRIAFTLSVGVRSCVCACVRARACVCARAPPSA